MIQGKKLYKQFQKRVRKLPDHLAAFARSADPEDLHRLRLGLKKLKAFSFMVEKTGALEKPPAGLTEIWQLFREAGEVRDRWMEHQLLSKLEGIPDSIPRTHAESEKEARARFIARAPEWTTKLQQLIQVPDPGFGKISKRKLEKLFRKQLAKLSNSLSKKNTPESLHPCRKKIKRLMILFSITRKEGLELRAGMDYLDQLQDIIGLWHDTEMVLKMLPKTKETQGVRQKLTGLGAGQLARARSMASRFEKKALKKGRF